MTNKIALYLGGILVAVFAADLLYFNWDLHIFIGRELMDLTEYLAFWR